MRGADKGEGEEGGRGDAEKERICGEPEVGDMIFSDDTVLECSRFVEISLVEKIRILNEKDGKPIVRIKEA